MLTALKRSLFRTATARASGVAPAPAGVPDAMIEALEARLALYVTPFLRDLPNLSDLTNANNSVVRMEFSQGFVDIELFDVAGPNNSPPAPLSVRNFLNYVESGRYDGTFLHRRPQGNFVLQGGGFSLKSPLPNATPRFNRVVTDAPVVNEFNAGRSNVERTLAYAKLGGDPNSATSQWFFNLGDNAQNLNNQNGGFTVFGRVVKGWDVVTRIAQLTTQNLESFLGGGEFTEVPKSGSGNTELVFLNDVELVKARNVQRFYGESVVFPDGFRSGRTTTDIELVNPSQGDSTSVQVIVRYESGQRDRVVLNVDLEPGAQRTFRLSRGGDPSIDRVRAGTPYSIEVRSTRQVGALWRHVDFNAAASAAFVNPRPLFESQLLTQSFAGGLKIAQSVFSYLPWTNVTGTTANVTVVVTSETGQSVTINQSTPGYRRGGLDLTSLSGLPDGAFSVKITSNVPVVAALVQYRANPARAWAETGVPSGGGATGVLPSMVLPTGGVTAIALAAKGPINANVTVDVDFILNDGTVVNGTAVVLTPAVPRREVSAASLAPTLPRDQNFTIRYRVRDGGGDVAGSAAVTRPDGTSVRASFQTASTFNAFFAGGFTDPAGSGQEVLSLFNPYASSANVTMTYRIIFHFASSGQQEVLIPTAGSGTLAAGRRVDISIRSLTDVMSRISSNPALFRRYGITVEATITRNNETLGNGAIVAQLTRFDGTGNSMAVQPTLHGVKRALSLSESAFTSST